MNLHAEPLNTMKITTTLALAILCIGFALPTWAQKTTVDVIHLKNGSVLRGKILSETSQVLELEMADQSVWVFPQVEVVQKGRLEVAAPPLEKGTFRKGFELGAEAGVMAGKSLFTNNWNAMNPAVHASPYIHFFTGYRVSPHYSMGVETGLDGYQEMAMLPLAFSVKGDFFRTNFTPYYTLSIGHAFPFISERDERGFEGGRVFQIGGGLRKVINSRLQGTLSIAYRQQNLSVASPTWTAWGLATRTDSYTFNRLVMGVGLVF
jgi:hypothetical protein